MVPMLDDAGRLKLSPMQETVMHTLMEDIEGRIKSMGVNLTLTDLRGVENLIRDRFAAIIKTEA